jgi:PAS domain S-box-containing protein
VKKPEPINEEIALDAKRYLVSETDEKGVITYANSYFKEIAGYCEEELLHQPHNLIRHPDMPKVVFKLLWETIGNGENINAVIKNLAKDGRYYWVFTEFKIKKDTDSGKIIGYMASRKAVSKHVIDIVSQLYKSLLAIEKSDGVDAAQEYLEKFLKEKGDDITFKTLMENIHKFY